MYPLNVMKHIGKTKSYINQDDKLYRMPQAVTHVLIAIILVDLYRDYFIKDKKKIPLSFVLLGGIAGLLPDIDIPVYWVLNNILGFNFPWIHRTITHSVFFPLAFVAIALVLHYIKKHKASTIFGIISFGITIHLLLDMFLSGGIMPFYPLAGYTFTKGLFSSLDFPSFYAGLDAIILIAWLWHEEVKHKIRDFI